MKKCLEECKLFYCIRQADKFKGAKCGRCLLKDADPICEACRSKDKCYKEAMGEYYKKQENEMKEVHQDIIRGQH
jgi:hypothetical protein